MGIEIAALAVLAAVALWTVMTRSLLRAGIGLGLTSAVLAAVIFRLHSPLAAVFELSVCSGLISVLFVSTISLTHPLTAEQALKHMKARFLRFWYLPVIVAVGLAAFAIFKVHVSLPLPPAGEQADVRAVFWGARQLDILGQILILLIGVFGVVILFGEGRNDAR